MQASNAPSKIYTPFAVSGTKNSIPIPSQISTTPGKASYTDGFPPLTLTPVASGGVPPFGADFNGILNAITQIQQWQSGGGTFSYDATWNTDNSGYPKGALLLKADESGFWFNTTDGNATDPDASGAGWVDLGAALASVVGGVGKTWQDMSASRALGTTYTNNSGGPIEVIVSANSTTASALMTATLGGLSVQGPAQATPGINASMSFTVPNGVTYSVSMVGSTTLAAWAELR